MMMIVSLRVMMMMVMVVGMMMIGILDHPVLCSHWVIKYEFISYLAGIYCSVQNVTDKADLAA